MSSIAVPSPSNTAHLSNGRRPLESPHYNLTPSLSVLQPSIHHRRASLRPSTAPTSSHNPNRTAVLPLGTPLAARASPQPSEATEDSRPQSGVSSPRNSHVAGRTSSENTAVSIFSMYVDEVSLQEPVPQGSGSGVRNRHVRKLGATEPDVAPSRSRGPIDSRSPRVIDSMISEDSVALPYLDGHDSRKSTVVANTRKSVTAISRAQFPRSANSYNAVPAAVIADYIDVTPPPEDKPFDFGSYVPSYTTIKGFDSSLAAQSSQRSHSSLEVLQPSSHDPIAASIASSSRFAEESMRLPGPVRMSAESSSQKRRSRISTGSSVPSPPRTPPRRSSPAPFVPASPSRQFSTSAISASFHSQPLSHRGTDEDADAEHVRNTYARFEAKGGVPGDGFEEGIERTRARLSVIGMPLPDEAGPTKTGDLSPKEEGALRNLDRYGFFSASPTMRQESRLALLPAAPFAHKIKRLQVTVSPVSVSQVPSPPEFKHIIPSKPPTKEVERLAKWTKMMRPRKHDSGANVVAWSADGYGTNKETFHRRVWKGIPDRWRPAAWQLLIHQSRHSSRPFVDQGNILNQYRTTSDMPSPHDVQIDLDVPRTVNNHVLFHTRYGLGQRSLFHILHSFSLFCSECEYCQGMGPIAATLLCYLDPEHAYAGIIRIHDQYDMHSVFKPGFPGLLEGIYVQERLLETLMPEVYKSFQKHMISSTSYATKWYITLFANSVPFQTQLRIWDAFLLEGRDVIIVFAVAILWSLRAYLASPQASLETILSLLSSYFVPEDEDVLVSWVQTTLGNKQIRSQMTQWRQSWQGLLASGQDSTALI